ncbi:hypothetical protein P3W24_18265 [Luteibacter sp. PPL201]|uniref:Glycosyltransferase family 4 protein n=1 Tax=Luteibacter sahnii TaxID=3021977 RepID=A0ABT6BG03_9GAMM
MIDSSLAASYHRGHPEHFATGFAESCVRKGHPARVICHKRHFADFSCAVPVVPALSASLHDRSSNDEYDGGLDDFHVFESRFVEDLLASGETVSAGDLILMPTASARELAGLGKWLCHLGTPVRVAAIFHWGNARSLNAGTLDAALMRRAGRSIKAARPVEVRYTATTVELARALSGPLDQKVDLTTSLTFLGAMSRKPRQSERKRIGILGGARREKGEDIIRDLIGRALADRHDIEFVVQDHRVPQGDPSMLAPESPRVTLLGGWLDEDDMQEICGTLDLAVLPYERQFYGDAVSGVFTLMSGFGVPCIVPSGTWMSRRIQEGEAAGIVYHGDDAQAVHAALVEALDTLGPLQNASAEKVPQWRSKYSAESWIGTLPGMETLPSRPSAYR